MQISRRHFTGGLLSASAASSGGPSIGTALPAPANSDDAYERLLGELIRVEEAAIYGGGGDAGTDGGPLSWQGRHLEDFISGLDSRVDLPTAAGDVYREFKSFVQKRIDDEVKQSGNVTAELDDHDRPRADQPESLPDVACEPDRPQATGQSTLRHRPGV